MNGTRTASAPDGAHDRFGAYTLDVANQIAEAFQLDFEQADGYRTMTGSDLVALQPNGVRYSATLSSLVLHDGADAASIGDRRARIAPPPFGGEGFVCV